MIDDPKISNAASDERRDLDALRALRPHDVDAVDAARLGARGASVFEAAHGLGGRSAIGVRFVDVWSRFGVPVMLAGVVCVYLGWAVQATSALYR